MAHPKGPSLPATLFLWVALLLAASAGVARAGITERVSVASDGTQGNSGFNSRVSISADGRFVAFPSPATNLVAGDTNGFVDIFVRDRVSGTTERVSVATDGTLGNNQSFGPSISADGRFVAFESTATNLVAASAPGAPW
jgi:Tol biopolymer transport system component